MSAAPRFDPVPPAAPFDGLDLLSTAVIVLDASARIVHVNQAAELLLSMSRKNLLGQSAERVIGDELQMQQLVTDASANAFGDRRQLMELKRFGREPVPVRVTAMPMMTWGRSGRGPCSCRGCETPHRARHRWVWRWGRG